MSPSPPYPHPNLSPLSSPMNTLNQSMLPQGLPLSTSPDIAPSPSSLHLHLPNPTPNPRLVLEEASSSAIVGGFLRSFLQKDNFSLPPHPPVALAVSVFSAVMLERKQLRQIEKKMQRLTGFQHIKLENTVDASLIAGFVIRYGDDDAHVIDLSVKGQLAEIAQRLESSDQSRDRDFSGVF